VDKAVGGAIDKLGSFGYRVTGPWTEPRIERAPGALIQG
jgi:uncharacterized protein YhdP